MILFSSSFLLPSNQIWFSFGFDFFLDAKISKSFLGLYGNDDLHNGLLEVLTAGRKVDNLVSSVRNQTNALEHTLTQKIRPQLSELTDIFDEPVSNQTALKMLIGSLEMVQKNITIATNAAGDIRRPLMGISLNHILNVSEERTDWGTLDWLTRHKTFTERRSIRVDSLAWNCRNACTSVGLVCSATRRCRSSLSLRFDIVLCLWPRRCYWLMVDVWHLSLRVCSHRWLVRRPSWIFGLSITARLAVWCTLVLYAMREHSSESLHSTSERIANRNQQRPELDECSYQTFLGSL